MHYPESFQLARPLLNRMITYGNLGLNRLDCRVLTSDVIKVIRRQLYLNRPRFTRLSSSHGLSMDGA